MKLNKQQAKAKEEILDWAAKHPRFMSLQGAAGTGKTTLLGEILPELRKRFTDVIFTAMTGKAALRLSQAAGVSASTLHKALYIPPGDDSQDLAFEALNEAPAKHLLVVDEASMITPDIWEDLLKWVELGVSVLLVGDGYQLPPVMSPAQVKAHGDSYSVFAHVKGPHLTECMRSGDDILRVATVLREEQKITRETRGTYSYVAGKDRGAVATGYVAAVQASADVALITWRNAVRMDLNKLVRHRLGLEGGPKPGEPILFCKNGYGVLNGEVSTLSECTLGPTFGPVQTHTVLVHGKPQKIRALLGGKEEPMDGQTQFLQEDAWRAFIRDKRAYKIKSDPVPITWGYVLTAHKAQGSEFDEVTVYLEGADGSSKPFSAPSKLPSGEVVPFWCRFLYTALTRAKRSVALVMGK